jgi:CAAD domains of cyanobacterial aminoacyl-tRNA synthetase
MMEIPVDQPTPKSEVGSAVNSPFGTDTKTTTVPFIQVLRDYWQQLQTFWQMYQKPLSLGFVLLIAGMYAYIIVMALLSVINALLVMGAFFKLVGFGYSVWFIYRHLLWARNREELKAQFEQLKAKVLGFAHHLVES